MPTAKREEMKSEPRPVTPWGSNVDILDGLDLLDKSELLDRPFLIESVWFEVGQRSVEYVYVQGQFEDGTEFTFNDSSSGVYKQIESYLALKETKPELGQVVPIRLVIPSGLRVSEYEVRDDRGREKKAKTYYLTTSGKRIE